MPVHMPLKSPRIALQIWDKDLLNSNDYISEATLNIQEVAKLAYENDTQMSMYEDGDNSETKFRVPCYRNKKNGGGQLEECGSLLVSCEFVPQKL